MQISLSESSFTYIFSNIEMFSINLQNVFARSNVCRIRCIIFAFIPAFLWISPLLRVTCSLTFRKIHSFLPIIFPRQRLSSRIHEMYFEGIISIRWTFMEASSRTANSTKRNDLIRMQNRIHRSWIEYKRPEVWNVQHCQARGYSKAETCSAIFQRSLSPSRGSHSISRCISI